MTQVRRALVSVYDKTGLVPFAKSLKAMHIEIISTGGTAELLKKEGIPVREVSEITKFPEMLGGRVKTLHPNLHAGILALRENPGHLETLAEHNIQPIDLVVVNLYPFWDAVKTKSREEEIIEMIDVGGPTMLRAAAKNFRFVASVCDPADYPKVAEELEKNGRCLGAETLKNLAAKVFCLTARYDGLISDYFHGRHSENGALPSCLTLDFEKISDLRYGENSHQRGALYREKGGGAGVTKAKQLHGKELSFNNILDLDAAFSLALDFDEPACSIVKHTNPCGFAIGRDWVEAFKRAYATDPLSAFGSIVGFNGAVDEKLARELLKSDFLECVIAKSFSQAALGILKTKKNLRLLTSEGGRPGLRWDFKRVTGGLLLQEPDTKDPAASDLKCVTKRAPAKAEIEDLLFAFKVSRYLKSNAIVVAKGGATLGLGMGLTSRVDSCRMALSKAGKRAKRAVLASDGFFPKPDSIALAKRAGIGAIIQPGGSIQDEAITKACDRAGIRMVFAGIRHFKH